MSKNTQKKYRKCPNCSNLYPEDDIQVLSERLYDHFSDDDPVYCLRCEEQLVKVFGNFKQNVTEIVGRNLGDTTIEEIGQKMFENRQIDKRR
jgi:hypothetical protein